METRKKGLFNLPKKKYLCISCGFTFETVGKPINCSKCGEPLESDRDGKKKRKTKV